jgi:tetratricopeptide (TPR) repeat protein
MRALVLAFLVVGPSGLAFAQSFNSDAEARFNIGIGHLREGRYDLAIEAIKQAIKTDPKNAFFYKGLGTAYVARREYKDAIAAYRRALELNPYYVDVKNDLGTALMLSGNRDEGKREFLTLFNDPTNATPEITSRNLGQAFLEEKNYPEALNWFQTTVSRNKGYMDGYLGASDALLGLGRIEDALAMLEAANKQLPNDPQGMLALGELYLKLGRLADARKKLEAVSQKDPMGPLGRRALDLLKTFPQ